VFVEAFCRRWCPNDYEQWLPNAEKSRKNYSAQNPIEEAPDPPLADDEAVNEEDIPDLRKISFGLLSPTMMLTGQRVNNPQSFPAPIQVQYLPKSRLVI
jgi:hypothetical protein